MNKILKKIIFKLIGKAHRDSSESYIDYLRRCGIKIGKGCIVNSPQNITIDTSRPELLEIGDNVLLHKGTIILTHDFASRTFVNLYNDFVPSHGRIKIGNNVWLGENVTILKNVEIGDNVVIGTGSLVVKSIPENSVAVGRPAKVICTIQDYYTKRRVQFVDEAIDYALAIYDSGRVPQIEDFYDDYPAFVDGHNWQEYDYPYFKVFTHDQFEIWKENHHAPFNGFDEFMKEVNERRSKN